MNSANLINFAVAVGVLAVLYSLWRVSRPRPFFTVRLLSGDARAVHGEATSAFLDRVREVAAAHEIESGAVFGLADGELVRLSFSSEFNEAARQQLRNWWATFGWTAPPPDRPRRVAQGRR